MAYDYSQAGYSPEVTDYLNQLEAQRAALVGKYAGQNVGLDRPDILTPMQVQQPASDEIRTEYMPEEAVRAYMAQNPTISESMFRPGVDVRSYGGSRDPSVYDVARLPYGGEYTFTNKATGQTYKASTPEQIQAIGRMTSALTGPGGNNVANFEIRDASGKVVASDLPYTPSFLKQAGQTITDLAVEYGPMIAALAATGGLAGLGLAAAPGLGGLSLAGQMGVMGASSALGKALKTGDLEKSLLSGAMSAAGTGAMAYASPYINRALTDAGLSFPGMNTLFSPTSPEGLFTPGGGSVGAYGPSTGGVSKVGGIEQALVRPGAFYPGVGALAGVIPAQLTSGITNSPSYADQPGVEEVNPTAERTPGTDEYGAPFLLPTGLAAPSDSLADYDTGEQLGYDNKPTDPAEDPSTLDKYLRYADLGLTGASLLGGLFGGSGGQTGAGGTIPAGFGGAGKLPPGFGSGSASLPTGAAIPAYGGGVTPESRMARTAADLGDIDYLRYGFGPEKSFFANVPRRAAKGGPMAAKPISDGRSDDIPAVLSDGEYVIDAETVALLGNGSNKAGAAQLDRFRANIRKHKGKELAKGRFSVNAKKPQAYLAGGRT
jgi:hypothetical protein